MESLSFDGLVSLYDETRTFDRRVFGAAIEYLTGRFPPELFSEVLEPGVGTGRVAFPLADKGYHVTGVDISDDMLAVLQHRLDSVSPRARISYSKADVTRLPFGNDRFDMAVATFGERLREVREQKGWSQNRLAELSGVSREYIRHQSHRSSG
jgi:ubiquinone/menaquinone biosynthesis C-methylase UbiE